jgi:uncharacterized SAM-binding protein YcdF (DUF218 family)
VHPRWSSPRAASTLILTMVIAIALLIPVGATVQVVLASQLDDRSLTQAIVMLDPGRVWGDPEAARVARIEHAATLYREGVAPVVMVTGPSRTHAASRAALWVNGVPPADVITFQSGADTVGPLAIVASVMRDLNWSSATVVTDPAHAARVQATASELGLDARVSPTDEGSNVSLTSDYVGREVAALLRHHAFTRWTLPSVVDSSPAR